MNSSKKNIVVDVERMKYPNTGLHNFCLNLQNFISKNQDFKYLFFAKKKVELPQHISRFYTRFYHKIYLKLSSKIDLWHCTFQNTKYVPKLPTKFMITIHDLNFLYEEKTEQKRQKLLKKIQGNIDRACFITTISQFVLDDLHTHLDLKDKKTKVIYNGVNLVEYPDFELNRFKIPSQFLFALGTVLPKKNFHVLLNLLQENPSKTLVIAGIQTDEHYLNLIHETAKQLNVSNQVMLLGPISEEEKYWLLKHCDAFLFPSLAEGFGLPAIEAMLLGKPVFLSTKTSLPEIGGNVAYYFQNFDLKHMNHVFKRGMEDYTQNNREEAIKKWAAQFSWDRAAKAYIDVYKEILC